MGSIDKRFCLSACLKKERARLAFREKNGSEDLLSVGKPVKTRTDETTMKRIEMTSRPKTTTGDEEQRHDKNPIEDSVGDQSRWRNMPEERKQPQTNKKK